MANNTNLAFPPDFGIQFVDKNGKPLSGGKLYTYEAGTETPLVTYKTVEGGYGSGNVNTNPIVLDIAGRAQLVLLRFRAYKLVLTDADDNVVQTWDNVTAIQKLLEGSGPIEIDEDTGIITITAGSITREYLSNYHNLIPDANYLQLKDFNGEVVVTLSDALQAWLTTQGYTP